MFPKKESLGGLTNPARIWCPKKKVDNPRSYSYIADKQI